jgi:hypothetical protein
VGFVIPVVFCIDAEPDAFTPDPTDPTPWRGYEATHRLSSAWRARLEEATGAAVNFSWFVRSDPQVAHIYGSPLWPFERYRRELEAAALTGDELGLHVHVSRWSAERSSWLEDFASAEWAEHCIVTAAAAYRQALGRSCESVRIGNHFMTEAASAVLERCGFRYDLTPEPGAQARDWLSAVHRVEGTLPDQQALPRRPHRRSKDSVLEADDERNDGIFVLPVSTAPIDASSPPAARAASDDGAYLRLGLWYPTEAFKFVVEASLDSEDLPCLILVMRSDMPLIPSFAGHMEENLAWIASHPLARRFRVSGPASAMAAVLEARDRHTHVEATGDRDIRHLRTAK